MLKVRLKSVVSLKKKHIVYLDSENRYEFTNKRKAKDFLRHISKEMTACLFFLNEEFLELNKYYRHYFLNDDHHLRQRLQKSVEFVDDMINSILRNGASTSMGLEDNRNTYTIKAIENGFFELLSAYKLLIGISKKRMDPLTRQKIELRYRITELYMIDFKHFEERISVKNSQIEIEDILNPEILFSILGKSSI